MREIEIRLQRVEEWQRGDKADCFPAWKKEVDDTLGALVTGKDLKVLKWTAVSSVLTTLLVTAAIIIPLLWSLFHPSPK